MTRLQLSQVSISIRRRASHSDDPPFIFLQVSDLIQPFVVLPFPKFFCAEESFKIFLPIGEFLDLHITLEFGPIVNTGLACTIFPIQLYLFIPAFYTAR